MSENVYYFLACVAGFGGLGLLVYYLAGGLGPGSSSVGAHSLAAFAAGEGDDEEDTIEWFSRSH